MKKQLLLLSLFTINLLVAQIPSYVPSNGLIGYWPFNGNANDVSGNGNNGTVNGATLTTDRFGNPSSAYNFDGIDDWINGIINNSNLNDCSFSVWINTPNITGGSFIHLGRDNGNPYCNGIGFGNYNVPNNNNLVGHYSCTGFFNSSANFNSNQWYLCTMVRQNNILKFYINSSFISQVSTSGLNNPENYFWFGTTYQNYLSLYSGKLDDIGIWNRALTQAEITGLYSSLSTSQNIADNTITIYPNPANDHITIDCGNLTNVVGYQIKIVNTLGQEVFSGAMNTQQYVVPLNTWTGTGVYFVKIYDANNNLLNTKKIILQ